MVLSFLYLIIGILIVIIFMLFIGTKYIENGSKEKPVYYDDFYRNIKF